MQVLLLNSTYEPIKIISWKKAIILHFRNKIEIIEQYENHLIHSVNIIIPLPAVVKLYYYFNIQKYKNLACSKENIFFRDNYTCLYCKTKFPKYKLSLDHVIPLSKGGKKTWDNLATACHQCNNKKGNNYLSILNSKLRKNLFKPSIKNYIKFNIKLQQIPKQWKNYLN